jgi:molybdopterin-guanine dinucleotide biosynthesis protein A
MCGAGRVDAAGFVLAGGRSTRMGIDKALLWKNGRTLLDYAATQMREAAGNVTIIADPARYAQFGFPVVPDHYYDCGPLGGLATALDTSRQPWNLITACDLPYIDAPFLRTLLEVSLSLPPGCDCIVPLGPRGPEPLCAVYHRNALTKIRTALDRNILKMQTLIASMETRFVAVADPRRFRNINTPEDWAAHE